MPLIRRVEQRLALGTGKEGHQQYRVMQIMLDAHPPKANLPPSTRVFNNDGHGLPISDHLRSFMTTMVGAPTDATQREQPSSSYLDPRW